MISFILAVTLAGCGKSDGSSGEGVPPVDNIQNNASREESGSADKDLNSSADTVAAVTELEVTQYYDIPSRYEIPSAPETVTSEKAGEIKLS